MRVWSCHCYVTYICFTWLIYYAIYTYVRVCDLMEINTPINHATEVSENNMQITGSWMPPWVTEKTVYLTWSVLWLLMTGALYYQCIRISGVGPVILEYSNISARGTNTSKYRSTDDTISCGISFRRVFQDEWGLPIETSPTINCSFQNHLCQYLVRTHHSWSALRPLLVYGAAYWYETYHEWNFDGILTKKSQSRRHFQMRILGRFISMII